MTIVIGIQFGIHGSFSGGTCNILNNHRLDGSTQHHHYDGSFSGVNIIIIIVIVIRKRVGEKFTSGISSI